MSVPENCQGKKKKGNGGQEIPVLPGVNNNPGPDLIGSGTRACSKAPIMISAAHPGLRRNNRALARHVVEGI